MVTRLLRTQRRLQVNDRIKILFLRVAAINSSPGAERFDITFLSFMIMKLITTEK